MLNRSVGRTLSSALSSTYSHMADTTSSNRIHLDITVSGYLLTREMVKQLCLLKYGFTTDQVNGTSSIDCATLYYAQRHIMESPRLLDVVYKKTETRWLLVGGAAFFRTGTTPPKLVLDAELKAYLDHWFPPDLHHRDEFKGMYYTQILWPHDVIRASLTMPCCGWLWLIDPWV